MRQRACPSWMPRPTSSTPPSPTALDLRRRLAGEDVERCRGTALPPSAEQRPPASCPRSQRIPSSGGLGHGGVCPVARAVSAYCFGVFCGLWEVYLRRDLAAKLDCGWVAGQSLDLALGYVKSTLDVSYSRCARPPRRRRGVRGPRLVHARRSAGRPPLRRDRAGIPDDQAPGTATRVSLRAGAARVRKRT